MAGNTALILVTVGCFVALIFLQLELHRRSTAAHARLREEQYQDFRQVEALFSLFATLKPHLPIPPTREWAASPDLLTKITALILSQKPDLVVEASSGVSTLIAACCLRELGRGKVVSLEHDSRFADLTRDLIQFHGLTAFAEIIHCPLVKVDIGGQSFLWYDTSAVNFEKPIDLLVIDGPPHDVQKLARYPALPVLFPHLSATATVILDDARRPDETEIGARWAAEFPAISSEFLPFEKGAFVFRMR
jgi:predicted O-methyltransferase YrrM